MQVTQAIDLQRGELVIGSCRHVARARFRVFALRGELRAKHLLPIVNLYDRAGRGLEVKLDETCDDSAEVHR